MRQRLLTGCAVTMIAAVIAAGCGVPSRSEPIDRGTAPAVDVREGSTAQTPQGPDDGGGASALNIVERYFQAAAWGNSKGGNRPDAVDEAERRVRGFLRGDVAQAWSAGNRELNLVKVTLGDPRTVAGGVVAIEATLEPVGVLDDVGSVHPPATTAPVSYTFSVVTTDSGRHRRLLGVPTGLFLDVAYLTEWYDLRTIYFWAADSGTVLVPDQRYLPKAIGLDKQPNEVWRWLIKGPSEQIAPAVATVPDTIKLKGNVVTERDRAVLVVDLSSEAAGQHLQTLVDQLRWSMRPSVVPVELRIEGVKKEVDGASDQYLRFNPAVWPEGQTEPEKLFIVGGKIQFVNDTDAMTSRILAGAENRDVVSAALAREAVQQRLAFIRSEPGGVQRLWIGQLVGQGDARAPTYQRTEVVGASLSRPVWLTGSVPRILLSVDGKLVSVTSDGNASPVEPTPGVPRRITAIAAAPDGRRLGIVGDQQAGIAPLRVDGDTLSLRGFQPLPTGLADPTGIGWIRQDTVLVGGKVTTGSPLVELSVDGTRRNRIERQGLNGLQVSGLVAYPNDPSRGGDGLLAMFEAGGQAYNVYGQVVEPLLPGTKPSPSASGAAPLPRAPLFYESI